MVSTNVRDYISQKKTKKDQKNKEGKKRNKNNKTLLTVASLLYNCILILFNFVLIANRSLSVLTYNIFAPRAISVVFDSFRRANM